MAWTTPTDTPEVWGYWFLRTGLLDDYGWWDDNSVWRDEPTAGN